MLRIFLCRPKTKKKVDLRHLGDLSGILRVGGGGHWPRKGVWGCAVLKTPFSRLSCSSQGSHFKQKCPLLRKFGNFILYSLNFRPNFSSQAPKFGHFQLTSPQILKFSVHKPPLFRGKYQFASPTLRKSWPHIPTWKKVECRPSGSFSWIKIGVTTLPGARVSRQRPVGREWLPPEKILNRHFEKDIACMGLKLYMFLLILVCMKKGDP